MRSLRELMDLSGRGAIIVGGAGHVALAAGEALHELGASIALIDRDAGECERRASLWGGHAFPCDLADEASTRGAVTSAIEELGGADVVVHCAALVGTSELAGWAVPLEEQTVAAWDAALRINLTSAFAVVQAAREPLEASGRGTVVLFSSIYGHVGPDPSLYAGTTMSNPAGYAASKGGLIQLARHLATVLAPRVRVNTISPGGIDRGQPEAFRGRYVQRTPLGRMATEEDVKGAVAYLASDLSAYVTGQDLVVDGGWMAW